MSYYDKSLAEVYAITGSQAVKKNSGERMLSFDKTVPLDSAGSNYKAPLYLANSFNLESNQKVSQVMFYSSCPGADYEVYIAPANNSTGRPADVSSLGKVLASGTITATGYRTATLSPSFLPPAKGKYAAVVKLINTPTAQSLWGDCEFRGVYLSNPKTGENQTLKTSIHATESWTSTGSAWSDISTYSTGNLSIRAITYKLDVISVSLSNTYVFVGSTIKLTPTFNPTNASDKRIKSWTSSSTQIATVDKSGNVKGVAAGTVTIKAITNDGSKIATCKITVINGARMGGADRYETAIKIAKKGWPSGADTVVLAYGLNYPDALAGTTLAAMKNAPILLTNTPSAPTTTMNEIKALKPKNIILLGGTGVISSAQATVLKNAGYTVTRYGGADRYETARLIGNAVEALGGAKTAVLVTGVNYPDALSMSSVAGMNKMPIIFSTATGLPAATTSFISNNHITKIVSVGYTAATATIIRETKIAVGTSNVTYITGADRYATSLAVANKYKSSFANGVALAIGNNFPDALTGGALAAKLKYPVLLIPPSAGATAGEKVYIKSLTAPQIYVFGGTGVISDAVIGAIYL